MGKLRFAPIIRVSTERQEQKGESLKTQTSHIKDYVTNMGGVIPEHCWKYKGQEHATPGFEHTRLMQLLEDSGKNLFDAVIVDDNSRWSRDNQSSKVGLEVLRKNGIRFFVGRTEMDLFNPEHCLILGMTAEMNEFFAKMQAKKSNDNRIHKAHRGIPTAGTMPYGRHYDKKTGKWTKDIEAVDNLKDVAERYLKGEAMLEIARSLHVTKSTLIARLRNSGETWTVRFKDHEPIIHKVPRLLPDDLIAQVIDRLEFKRRNNRTDIVNKYLLSGFLRCDECNGLLTGVTQINYNKPYSYYKHVSKTTSSCKSRPHLRCSPIDHAVFETILENVIDVPSFERAIAKSLPDSVMRGKLEKQFRHSGKMYVKTVKELDKLTVKVSRGIISDETAHNTEQNLLSDKKRYKEDMDKFEASLNSLPPKEEVLQNADRIRRKLLEKYGGKNRLKKMTYNEKRELLHWLFDGKDQKGTLFGIYVSKKGTGKDQSVDYFMYGKITGIRTLKGEDIDYMVDEEDKQNQGNNSNYNTRIAGRGR